MRRVVTCLGRLVLPAVLFAVLAGCSSAPTSAPPAEKDSKPTTQRGGVESGPILEAPPPPPKKGTN